MWKKISLAVFLTIAIGVLGRFVFIAIQQNNEFDFHTNIPKTITLASTDFYQNEIIPIDFTGNGKELSPELHWSNLPKDTKSLVILCTDYDGPSPLLKLLTIDHWVVYNIPVAHTSLAQGSTSSSLMADGILSGKNFKGTLDYKGPKPPFGKHRYFFRIYALSTSSLSLVQPSKKEVMEQMKNHVLAYGELIGIY